jgi:hypothetical protein
MATLLTVRANYVDADVPYSGVGSNPLDYLTLDLATDRDYLIWSEDLEDLMNHEPTVDELNAHAVIIDESNPKTVPECLVFDYSGDIGGVYFTHLVKGMSLNKRYVFCFSFDGATANIPQLEAWEDTNHTTPESGTTWKHVLGYDDPDASMIKAICTTNGAPGASWVGTAIAFGDPTRVVKLDTVALATAKDLYANIKIVIPTAYAIPAVESFTLTVRYAWN